MAARTEDPRPLFDSGKMHYGRLPMLIFGGVYLVLGIALASAIVRAAVLEEPGAPAALLAAVVITGLLTRGYSRVRVVADELWLDWFPFYRTRIPLSTIRSAAPAAVKGFGYGFGLRLGTFGIGLIQETGPAVRLDVRRGYLVTLGTEERREALLSVLRVAGVPVLGA